ncbi:MAG: hypothetical protein RSA44_04265 [Bacteroides sp.]
MDTQISQTAFFKSRSLAGRLSASFQFINKNFSLLLKLSSFILLPMAVLSALYMAVYPSNSTFVGVSVVQTIAFALVGIVCFVSFFLFNSFLYSVIQKYAELGVVPNLTLKNMKLLLITNAKKLLLIWLVFAALFILYGALVCGLAYLSLYTLLLTIPLFFFLIMPLSYTNFIYLYEGTSIVASFKKSFKLGLPSWGSIFVIVLLMGCLAALFQLIVSLPWMSLMMAASFANVSMLQGDVVSLPGYFGVLVFFLSFISVLLSSLSSIIVTIPMAFQYASVEASRREREQEETQSL